MQILKELGNGMFARVQVLKEFVSILQPGFSSSSAAPKHIRLLGTHAPTLLSADKCDNADYEDCKLESSLICPLLYM